MTQTYQLWVWTAQSVQRLATGWTVRGSIPVVERSVADRLLGLWVRILPVAWTFVLCELYTKDKTQNAGQSRRRSKYKDRTRESKIIPVGATFFAPVQTGPGAHPAYTMGTGSFPGVKRPGSGVNHPSQLAPRLKKEWSYTYSRSAPSWPLPGRTLPFYLYQ